MRARILKALIVLAVLIGAFFLLHSRVLWLDYFNGSIVDKQEKTVATVIERRAQNLTDYYWQVASTDGRLLELPVTQLQYFRSRVGMKVRKKPFTSEVELIE